MIVNTIFIYLNLLEIQSMGLSNIALFKIFIYVYRYLITYFIANR
jgi:hypothetical protein